MLTAQNSTFSAIKSCFSLRLCLFSSLIVLSAGSAAKKKDDVSVVAASRTKPSDKKKGREKWMQDYRIDDDNVEWGEDKEGIWWRRAKSEPEWTEWEKAL